MSHIQHTLYFLSKNLPPSYAPHGVLCWRGIVFGSVLLTGVTWINYTLPVPPPSLPSPSPALFVNEFVTRCLSPFHRSPPSLVFLLCSFVFFLRVLRKDKAQNAVIMGRKTWDSIPVRNALPHRYYCEDPDEGAAVLPKGVHGIPPVSPQRRRCHVY